MHHRPRLAALATLLVAIAVLTSGCGSVPRGASDVQSPQNCRATVMNTVAQVAERAYAEVASGRLITSSRAEVLRAHALLHAVAAGEPAAATLAAKRLMAHTQIAFLQVARGPLVLVNLGSGPAIAGASGVLRDASQPPARFVLAVQGSGGYAAVVHGLTGTDVLVRAAGRQIAGTVSPGPASIPSSGVVRYRGASYVAYSFTVAAYPAGDERISLLAPPSLFRECGATTAQTVTNLLGTLAMRVYDHEWGSHTEQSVVAYIERSQPFVAAVSADNRRRTRAAIVTFFRSHRHVVRVRAFRGGRLVIDVGGPYALAPVSGTLRERGRVVGSFVTAIQDDAGFVALTHIYTGAQIILRVGDRDVPSSTMHPGPASIPSRGSVTYQGRRYEAFSFDGQAFPAGSLRISLLVPVS